MSKAMAPPPRRGFGNLLLGPLLVFNFLATIVFLGVAAWESNLVIGALNEASILENTLGRFDFNVWQIAVVGFEGNAATPFLVISALIAGVVAVGSYVVGLHHLRVRTTPSATAAQSAAWIAFGLLMLPFALVWKEIELEGPVGDKTKVAESFVIVVTVVHFAYTLLLYVPE